MACIICLHFVRVCVCAISCECVCASAANNFVYFLFCCGGAHTLGTRSSKHIHITQAENLYSFAICFDFSFARECERVYSPALFGSLAHARRLSLLFLVSFLCVGGEITIFWLWDTL